MHEEIPVRFSNIVGDVVHNLRSALDCIAFELARRTVGGELTKDQERATAFPIKETWDEFDEFFADKRRVGLFTNAQIDAMRTVQPGHFYYRSSDGDLEPLPGGAKPIDGAEQPEQR